MIVAPKATAPYIKSLDAVMGPGMYVAVKSRPRTEARDRRRDDRMTADGRAMNRVLTNQPVDQFPQAVGIQHAHTNIPKLYLTQAELLKSSAHFSVSSSVR